jgi:hypothetical protein
MEMVIFFTSVPLYFYFLLNVNPARSWRPRFDLALRDRFDQPKGNGTTSFAWNAPPAYAHRAGTGLRAIIGISPRSGMAP